jgi:hypothetical protein
LAGRDFVAPAQGALGQGASDQTGPEEQPVRDLEARAADRLAHLVGDHRPVVESAAERPDAPEVSWIAVEKEDCDQQRHQLRSSF